MKLSKYGIIFVSVSMLVLSSAIVSAETITDGQNDVIKSTGGGTFQTGQTEPAVDIKQITYAVEDTTLTLELEMHGDIQLVSPYHYYVTVETTDFQYSLSIINGDIDAAVFDNAGSVYLPEDPEPVVDGTTLSAVFELQGDSTIDEVFGHAEYLVPEMLQDWAPDSRNPLYDMIDDDTPPVDDDTGGDDTGDDDTGDDDDDDTTGDDDDDTGDDDDDDTTGDDEEDDTGDKNKGTPGFELLILIAAIGVAFVILRRRT